MKNLILALLLITIAVQAKLPSYNASLSNVIVSGISSGGYMSQQFAVAYSSIVSSAAVVAGGPYGCALGQMTQALTACMSTPTSINLKTIDTKVQGIKSKIDDMQNIKKQKYYFYSGKIDTVVKTGVVKKAEEQIQNWGGKTQSVYNISSEHAWITKDFGNPCFRKGAPYISNCNFDMSLDFMRFFTDSSVKPAVPMVKANLLEFDQSPYKSLSDSMGDKGYYYLPTACKNGEKCSLAIVFHGCQQTLADIDTKLVEHSGMNEIAEANNIIVLYPQAKKSTLAPQNPQGCFDWWGYANSSPLPGPGALEYLTRDGKQMKGIYNMLKDLAGAKEEIEMTQ